ncbi:hypothetical protein M0813_17843 [Anaeramoeba flamelloides]|uniref:Right handed beta helix domain-containing protein n=1 Tax=Anaeramoeba flamelloides TaxID=1746091 RepID=A0ABQ8YU70_9EUKA|nr:hypothetical protein M0813_17843 [Anaeramoeba flamelloides]
MRLGIKIAVLLLVFVIPIFTEIQPDPIQCWTTLKTFEADGTVKNVVVVTTDDDLSEVINGAEPGDQLILPKKTYTGTFSFSGIQGTAENPIWIIGSGSHETVISGRMQFSESQYLILRNFELKDSTSNGINMDDSGKYDEVVNHHVIIDNLHVHNIGGTDNLDCIKLSGLYDFFITNNKIWDGSSGGSYVDMVGCHDGFISNNEFGDETENSQTHVQMKGGTINITVNSNVFKNAPQRGVNMGGSTGADFFRPPISQEYNYEAKWLRVVNNVFDHCYAPVAFVGCVECLVSNNVLYYPENWALRILQETTELSGVTFESCRDGVFANNIILFEDSMSRFCNVGSNTESTTFKFENNLWYCTNNANFDYENSAISNIPVDEINVIQQENPLFEDQSNLDFRLKEESSALQKGIGGYVNSDFDYQCYRDPPNMGAYSYYVGAPSPIPSITPTPTPSSDPDNVSSSNISLFPFTLLLLICLSFFAL